MKASLIINYDRDEFQAGESRYGTEFQIEINKNKINEPEYYNLVLKAMEELKKKTNKYRKENTIVYHNKRQERIDRMNSVVLTVRHTSYNTVEPRTPYNKWLVAVIKKNERERENLTGIAKMLKIN